MKKVAILQSNYIPWKGYFDMINMVDEFIIYDTVQYTKNDWRNRNLIKTPNGTQWLTIPVRQNSLSQRIMDTNVSDKRWNEKHWKSLKQYYSKASCFLQYAEMFEMLYRDCTTEKLSEINFQFITAINTILGIKTSIRHAGEFQVHGDQNEKLIDICKACNADVYLSGRAAEVYLKTELFLQENIKVEWMDYNDYPEYRQQYQSFTHQVSIVDLIFNEGDNAKNFMKSFR